MTECPPIPVIPDIDRKVYEAASQPAALDMNNWHTCETTHCRAGWVVHLAGPAGYALEAWCKKNVAARGDVSSGTAEAALIIYEASGSPINPYRFYDANKNALEDMRQRAERAQSYSE